jgi:hypothetical protein
MLLVSGTTKTMARIAATGPTRLGHLLTPKNRNAIAPILATGLPWAIDNGAFAGFNAHAFMQLLKRAENQPRLLWVAAPDVVGDAVKTLRSFAHWSPGIERMGFKVAFVGQDGAEDLLIPWGNFDCWFIGGSTEWKLSDASRDLCREAKRLGKQIHMGRVNSLRRMRRAQLFGCDTVDGSSASMFGDQNIEKFLKWLKWCDEQSILPLL